MAPRFTLISVTAAAAALSSSSSVCEAAASPPIFGENATKRAFEVWLSNWRNYYAHTKADQVPHLPDKALPKAFSGKPPKVVAAEGGAASGVVTEGMGYGLMIEGMMAYNGDKWAMDLAIGLAKSWLGMVQGNKSEDLDQPLGGVDKNDGSACKVDVKPYGVSAIPGASPAGVATWKFPRKLCYPLSNASIPCHGSATDGDEDAVLGLAYLAAALEYPADLVDVVVRSIIAFASSDLGFPDLYRTLPDGTRVFVPKAGSQWGGLTPPGGKFMRESGVPDWCTVPAYFAPANYRVFQRLLKDVWKPGYDKYLPPRLDGSKTSLTDLVDTFDAAITAGYNILYYSSCESGTVSNWVGVEAACASNDTLSCHGVPWKHTPYVGEAKGNCSASGTGWGRFGADASRMPWRISMDYALFPAESEKVRMFDRDGKEDKNIKFNARYYLNRITTQYRRYGKCDGGILGDCDCDYPGCRVNFTQAFPLSAAFEITTSDEVPEAPTVKAPGITCDNVPHIGQTWWAGFMSWPTFTAFIAPYEDGVTVDGKHVSAMNESMSRTWLESLAHLCDFRNFTEKGQYGIEGAICQKTYFHASQEVIATMLMSGSVPSLPTQGEVQAQKKAKTGAKVKTGAKAPVSTTAPASRSPSSSATAASTAAAPGAPATTPMASVLVEQNEGIQPGQTGLSSVASGLLGGIAMALVASVPALVLRLRQAGQSSRRCPASALICDNSEQRLVESVDVIPDPSEMREDDVVAWAS